MNGKKAKKLRRQAGVTTAFSPSMLAKEHKTIKHASADWCDYGTVTQSLLNQCNWTYYKELKRRSKNYTAT